MTRCSLDRWFQNGILCICIAGLAGNGALLAQEEQASPPPGQAPGQAQAQALAPQQLDNLVAPIALYPDPLLSQVLVASTYPLELVEAQQWLQANSGLRGQQLTDAARQQNWDPSVQAMVAMPDVLGKLTQDVRWTTDLGNAFLAQQAGVMSAVQRMRARAEANGKLRSTPQETVSTEDQNGQSAIQILPADPQVVYVPTYDPAYVWGPPAWGYYPPLYYPYYGYGFGFGINIGLCFGGWGGWGFGGWGWGWGPNWFGGGIFVNNFFFNHYGYRGFGGRGGFGPRGGIQARAAWSHDPSHRLGAAYSTRQLNSRFGAASQASRMAAGRSGNWHSFGAAGTGARSSVGAASTTGRNSFNSSTAGSRGSIGTANTNRGSWSTSGGTTAGTRGSVGATSTTRGGWSTFGGTAGRSTAGWSTRSSAAAPRTSASSGGAYARSYGGGYARSYSGGGGYARSSGGGYARSSGGGYARSSGGGGGRSSGGSSHSSGGGHGGRR